MGMNINALAKAAVKGVSAHSTEILTGAGLIFEGRALWSVGKVAPRALEMIKKEHERLGRPLTFWEKVKLTRKVWAGPALFTAASATCFIGSCAVGIKKNRALTAALSMSEAASAAYQEKVKEIVGEHKEERIREEVVKEQAKKDPPPKEVVYISGDGPELFRESLSGQYFRSDTETVRRLANDANLDMINGSMYMSKNDWLLGYLGIDPLADGEVTGWNTDRPIDIRIVPDVGPDGKEIVHIIMHNNIPYSGYDRVH